MPLATVCTRATVYRGEVLMAARVMACVATGDDLDLDASINATPLPPKLG